MNDDIRALVEKALLAGKTQDEIIFAFRAGMGEEYVPQIEEYLKKKRKIDFTEPASVSAIRPSVSESLSSEYVPAGFSQGSLDQQQKEIANAAAAEVYGGIISSRGNIEAVASDPSFEESYRVFRSLSDDPTAKLLPPSLVENGEVNKDAIPALKHGAILYANDYLKKEQERQKELGAKYTIPVLSELAAGGEELIGGVLKLTEALGGRTGELADFFIDDSAERVRDALIDYGLTEEEISKSFIENLSEGNFKAGLTQIGSTLVQQAPQLIVAAPAGVYGLVGLGLSSAGSKYGEIENRSDLTANEKMLYSLGVGTVEFLTEKLFMGDIKMLQKAFTKSGVDKMSRKEFGDVLFGALPAGIRAVTEEGVEEVIASAAQQTIGKFIAGDEIDPIEIVEGGIIGGLMGGGAYLASRGAGAISRQADRKRKAEAEAFVKNVDEKLVDPEISAREKDILRSKKEEAQGILRDIQAANDRIALSMSEEDLEKINNLRNELRKAGDTYKTLKTDEAKAAERQRITSIAEQITEIQNKYDSEKETGVPSPVVEGAPVVAAEPIVRGGEEAPEAGRVLQAPTEEGEITTVFNAESPIPMAVGLDVMYDNPITGQRDNGELIQDGQRVVFRSQTGKEFDIGNIEELADVKPEDVGLVIAQEIVSPQISINKDGSLTYNGEDQAQVKKGDRLRIGSDLGINAIRRRKRGGYKVDVMNDSGQMVSVTGPAAEEIAYQITLAAAQTPAGIEQINQLIQQDEKAQQLLTAAIAANEQRRKNAKPAARPAKEGPKAAVAEPARKRVEEKPTAPVAKEPETPREKMQEAVTQGKAFLKKNLSDVTIVTHETRADYDDAMDAVSRGKANRTATKDRGRFIRNTKTGKLEIHVNFEEARVADVAHEIFHAAFYKYFGQNQKRAKQFATDLAKVLSTGNSFEKELAKQLNDFLKRGGYTKGEEAEEILAETAGLLYQNSGKITRSMLDKIALFLNQIAEKLKLPVVFTGARDRAKIVDFLNSFATAISEQTGLAVDRTPAEKAFTESASKIAEKSSKIITAEDKELVVTALKAGYIVHATKSEFRVFDPNRIERTAYGFGFYFTGQADLAKSYGNRYSFIYSNELNLYEGNATISEAVLNRIKEAAETENEKLLAREIEVLYTRDGGEVRKYNRMNGIPVDVLNQKLIKESILQGKDPEKAFTVVTNEGLVSIPTSLEAERQLSVLLTKAGIDGFYTEVKEKYLRLGNAIDVAVVFNFEKLNKYVVSIEEIVGDHSRVALKNYNIDYDIERSSRVELNKSAARKVNNGFKELGIKEGSEIRFLGAGMFGFAIYVKDESTAHPNGLVIKGTRESAESEAAVLYVAKYNGDLAGLAKYFKWSANPLEGNLSESVPTQTTKSFTVKEYLPVKAEAKIENGKVISIDSELVYYDLKRIFSSDPSLFELTGSYLHHIYYLNEEELKQIKLNWSKNAEKTWSSLTEDLPQNEIPFFVLDNAFNSILSAINSAKKLNIKNLDGHGGNFGFVLNKDGYADGTMKMFDISGIESENFADELIKFFGESEYKDVSKNIVEVNPDSFREFVNIGTSDFGYQYRVTYIPVNVQKPAPAEYNFGHGNIDDAYDVREKASKEEPETKADKLIDAILNKHWNEIQGGYDVAFGGGLFGTGIYAIDENNEPQLIAEFSMKPDGKDVVVLDNFASVEGMGMVEGGRKGNGRRALRGILRLADEYGVRVRLLASPITWFKEKSETTQNKLIKFYESEGFVPDRKWGAGHMIREAGAKGAKDKPLPLNNDRYWGNDVKDVRTLEQFLQQEDLFDYNYVSEFTQEELDNLPPSIIDDAFFGGYTENFGSAESFIKTRKKDTWAIVSPQNEGNKNLTPDQNEKALNDAEAWFKKNDLVGFKVYTMFGGFKRVSFFVPNMSVDQVMEFNKEFGQINSFHSSRTVSEVPMNNAKRQFVRDEYGDPKGVWNNIYPSEESDNYIVIKKWDGDIVYFVPQYDIDYDEMIMPDEIGPEERSSKEIIEALESGRFEITDDGKGNYVFFHYSPEKIDTVKPEFFGKNAYTADRRITPISFYYTSPERQETFVTGDPNVVLVKKEEVYPFNLDPLNLYPEAKKRHDEYFADKFKGLKKAFDAPSQATWIMEVAAERGYKVMINAWTNVSRAETPFALKVDKEATAEFVKSGRERIYPDQDLRIIGMVDRSSRQIEDIRERIKDREVKSLATRIKDFIFWNPEQKEVRKLKETMTGQLTVEAQNIRRYVSDLSRLLEKSKPEASDYVSMILDGVLDPASVDRLLSLPNGRQIFNISTAMRSYVDSLSSTLLNDPAFVSLNDELKETIRKNIGSYVRASYRFWKGKNFKPAKGARLNAIQYEYEVLVANRINILERSGYSESEIDEYFTEEVKENLVEQATGIIDRYIEEIEKSREGSDFKRSGIVRPSTIKLPSQQFMKRKDLPYTIEELLGKERDPLVRFIDTTVGLSNIKYKGIMISNMLEQLGPDVIKNTDQITKSEESAKTFRQIKDEYSPLNGKWVRADLFEVLSEEGFYTAPKDMRWLQVYFDILKIARKSKVIWNIPTWRKNITGGWYTMLANGVFYNTDIVSDISNRVKRLYGTATGKELLDKEINDLIAVMGDYGLLGTSVDANMVGLMDITMNAAITGKEDDSRAKNLFNKLIGKGKSIDKWATENYSFIDDYTKLIIFRQEIQSTAKKLYGKEYDKLSEKELKEVHRFAAERVKENTPTFSRLPRFYRALGKAPFGDFLSFELEAIRSLVQNTQNALADIKKGMTDTGLNDVQKTAYMKDGMSRVAGISALLAIRLAISAGLASLLLGDDDELDKDAKVVRPDWMDGHSIVVTNISKSGEVTAYDYSLEDPYGNIFDIATDPARLPQHAFELFGPNMAVEFITNVFKGKDVYGRDIAENTDNLLNSLFKYTSYGLKYLFVPPAVSSYYRDYIKGESAEKPKDYFTALIARSTIRDYKYNAGAQFYFNAKELATGKKDFDELSTSGKRVRMKQLKEIREQYQAVVNIGFSKDNFEMIARANSTVDRNFSALERAYILYGYEPE